MIRRLGAALVVLAADLLARALHVSWKDPET